MAMDSKMKHGISVIICCYNSAVRLPATLKYLGNQQVANSLYWEVIVVNNNSTDATEMVAQIIWKSLGVSTSLKVVTEPKPGLSHAREKGVTEANYDILLWCDDDNWLGKTYVQTAYEIMNTNLSIGALGGWCEPAFEAKKPDWFDAQSKYFAVSKQGKRSGDITQKKGCLYGAGVVMRKSHHLELKALGFTYLLLGRTGTSLSSGEDTEYCYALRLLGYKMWYDERLYFKHYMPQGRLNLKYVSDLRRARTDSNVMLWAYLDLLKGTPRNHRQLLMFGFKGGVFRFIRKFAALFVGNYEQREIAKRYFVFQKYCVFNYTKYKNNVLHIRRWYGSPT